MVVGMTEGSHVLKNVECLLSSVPVHRGTHPFPLNNAQLFVTCSWYESIRRRQVNVVEHIREKQVYLDENDASQKVVGRAIIHGKCTGNPYHSVLVRRRANLFCGLYSSVIFLVEWIPCGNAVEFGI